MAAVPFHPDASHFKELARLMTEHDLRLAREEWAFHELRENNPQSNGWPGSSVSGD
jgi:hypothetical protein